MKRSLIIVDPSLKGFVGHHYEYDRAICAGAVEEGLEPVVLGHNDAIPEIVEALPFRHAFKRDIWTPYAGEQDLSRDAATPFANSVFYEEITSAIAALAPQPGSIIFGHMIIWRQLLAWAKFALEVATVKDYEVVILLRYQPEFYSDPHSARAFRMLERAALVTRVRIVTDSERLSSQIGRLTSLPVGVVPIPHIPELQHGTSIDDAGEKPLRVVSLGNARDEKGILELIQAYQILDAIGRADRFHFELQVNDPAGDIAPAIEMFARSAKNNVTLHRDALDSADYNALLQRADIVALPYWRSIYEARTSGVFLEAIAAAKPVICTDDTWMSDELARYGSGLLVKSTDASDLARQLLNAHEQFKELKAEAEACQARIRSAFNPQVAIDAILHDVLHSGSVTGSWHAAVLYPWGDALRSHSGASLRSNLLARFLTESGAEVRFLQNATERSQSRGAIRFESYPVDAVLNASKISKSSIWIAKNILKDPDQKDLFLRMYLHPEWDAAFANRLNEIVRWADVVFLEYSFWSPLVAKICRRHGKPLVLTTHDVLSSQVPEGSLRWATRQLEKRAMLSAPTRYSVSEEDQATFRAMGVDTTVIRHPIDVASMRIPHSPETRALLAKMIGTLEDTEHYFLFVGSAYGPNIAAAQSVRSIAAEYLKAHPDDRVCFVVVGGCHAPEKHDNFVALGRVDDMTLRLLYSHASAALVPLRAGTGASLKTIEAFGAGCTVVGTSLAFRGLTVTNEVECLVEETDGALVEAVARLVSEDGLLEKLSAAASRAGDQVDFHHVYAKYGDHVPADRRQYSQDAATKPVRDQMISHYLAIAAAASANKLYDVAEASFHNVIEIDPENGGAMLGLVRQRAAFGQTEDCIRLLDDALMHGAPIIECMRTRIDIKRLAGYDVSEDLTRIGQMFLLQTWSREAASMARARMWKEFEGGERRWIVDLIGPVLEHRKDYPDAGYWFLHAHSLLDCSGDLETSAAHFRRASELGFDPMWANFHRSRVLEKLGRIDESAEAMFISASAARAEHSGTFRDVGVGLLWKSFHAGLYAATLNLARALLKLGIDTPQVHFLIGESLKNSDGSKEEALAAFDKASESDQMTFWVRLNRGTLYASMGDSVRAKADFLKAYSEAKDAATNEAARAHAEPLLEAASAKENFKEVEEICTTLLAAWPNDATSHYVLAESLNISGRAYHDAIEHYWRAQELGHDAFWCCFNRSRAYARIGQPHDALNDLIKASALAETDHQRGIIAPLLSGATHSAFGAGAFRETAEAAAAWCQVAPANGEAHYLLAESLLILNEQLDTAEAHYTQALMAGHNSYWTHFNRAQLYRRLSRLEEATADLLDAIKLAAFEGRVEETASAACDLAINLKDGGMLAEARIVLETALTTSDMDRISELLDEIDARNTASELTEQIY